MITRGTAWLKKAVCVADHPDLPVGAGLDRPAHDQFSPLTRLAAGATVAPFSAIPLAILILVWFLPYLARRGNCPKRR